MAKYFGKNVLASVRGCLIDEVSGENKDIVLEDKEFAKTID
jgi:hypothetical protein